MLCQRQDGKGLRAVTEILINIPLASDLIRKGEVSKIKELMKKCRELGMVTFDQSLSTSMKRGRSVTRMPCAWRIPLTKCVC
jgi:twitching motility protein PilU